MNASGALDHPVNYEMLFNRTVARDYYGVEPEPSGRYYDDERGMFVRAFVRGGLYFQDLIKFAPDAFAFTGHGAPSPVPNVSHHRQVIGDNDWIHICLRLGVGGYEDISGYQRVHQPTQAGTITRYPARTEIRRASPNDDSWRTSCLWLRPSALTRLLETSAARLPCDLSWLAADKADTAHHVSVPLSPQIHLAVKEILDCPFRGGVRRAFVFSKYLEILAITFQAALNQEREPAFRLPERDVGKIREVASILRSRIDQIDSLASLARRVGINRTKLVLGFRAIYGTSVESYWRDWRMQEAGDLLQAGLSVSEVASRVGFSQVSSFSRAYTRQFGVAPSNVRSN